jgi:hypothetical protein
MDYTEEEATQPGISPFFNHFPPQFHPRRTSFSASYKAWQKEMAAHDPLFIATQLYHDDRRSDQGHSELTDEDAADIICILQPMTMPALGAANDILTANPRNTYLSKGNPQIREKNLHPDDIAQTFQMKARGLTSCGIALRLSADLKDPIGGFHFGRNPARCDFVIGRNEPSRRISNVHFRIYINEHATLMIEDQSTNGTVVDALCLRGKDKENGLGYKHTLENGQKIILVMTPPEVNYDFVVWIPKRSDTQQDAYEQKLAEFLENQEIIRDQRTAAKAGGHGDTVRTRRLPPSKSL